MATRLDYAGIRAGNRANAVHKQLLTDAIVKRAAPAKDAAGYRIRDSKLGGFFLHVGKGTKSFRLQIDMPDPSVPGPRKRRTHPFHLGEYGKVTALQARQAAEDIVRRRDNGEPLTGPTDDITLGEGWAYYKAWMEKNKRSDGTIRDYGDKVERCMKDLLHTPLRKISRQQVMDLHTEITTKGAPEAGGRKKKPAPYLANGCVRVGHAIYNYAATELDKPLPLKNPFRPKGLLNKEQRRHAALNERGLPNWFKGLKALGTPVWREFYLMVLLTGLRRRTLERMAWDHVHFDEGYIDIPRPKGGEERAFRVPISGPIRRSLLRLRRAGKALFDTPNCHPWVFPSRHGGSGHVTEPASQDIDTSPKALRHVFILLATGAGVIQTHRHVLTNHRLPHDVHNEYMNVPAMFDQLRDAQERISAYIMKHLGKNADGELERLLVRDLTAE